MKPTVTGRGSRAEADPKEVAPAPGSTWARRNLHMNRTQWIPIGLALIIAPIVASPAPTPGCADVASPGTWSQMLSEFGDSTTELELSDGQTYRFQAGSVFLTNSPGTSWYSPGDTNPSFALPLTTLAVDVRSPGDPSTNDGCLEVEVSAHGGPFLYLASYAGIPAVTNVPADPANGSSGYTITTARLSWARICISSNLPNSTIPVMIRGGAASNSTPGVELSWSSSSNGLFQLQWCSNLVEGSWADLGMAKAGAGTNVQGVAPVEPGVAQRFYRVLRFP